MPSSSLPSPASDKFPVKRRGGHLRLEKDKDGDAPQIGLRVPRSVHDELKKRADKEKTTISALVRRAVEEFISAR